MEFGKIKTAVDNFISAAPSNIRNKFIADYSKLLKKNKELSEQFRAYTNILYYGDSDKSNATIYVNNTINHLKTNYKIDKLLESNKKIYNLLKKYTDNPITDREPIMENIDNSIYGNFIKNGSLVMESINNLVNHIIERGGEQIDKMQTEVDVPINMLTSIVTRKFNQKYEELTEEEKKLFKSIKITDEDKRKEVFTETKKTCISLINDKITESTVDEKEKLLEAKEIILDMEYISENYVSDVMKINQLKENLKNN